MTSGKTYVNASSDYGISPRYYKIILPESGNILISSDAQLYYAICDSKKTQMHCGLKVLSGANGYKTEIFLEKGTYYIRTKGSFYEPSTLKYNFYTLDSSKYTIKSGKTTTLHGVDSSGTYLKFKADKTGYLKLSVAGSDVQGASVTMCDSKRKCLSSWSGEVLSTRTLEPRFVVYGVQKGKTYYVKVVQELGNHIKIKAKFVPVSEKSGSTRLSATKITSGKPVNGTISLGSSRADWYKFTLKSKKNVKINVSGNTNYGLKITLYDSDGQISTYASLVNSLQENKSETLPNTTNLEKGTYYIKVERYNSYSSGNYKLTYKIK
jgi:hypothetical protein